MYSVLVDFKHPIEVLKDNKGWVFVCYKNKEDSEIGAPQFEIPRKDFVRWVKSNGDKLANDTISNIVSDEYKRKTPKLWIQYIGNRGGAIPHYDIALKQQCWGIPQSASALKKFKEITKCPVLVNTSFNVRGEPIVNTPKDAFNCFMGTELDKLAIGNCYLDKKSQDKKLTKDYSKEFELD